MPSWARILNSSYFLGVCTFLLFNKSNYLSWNMWLLFTNKNKKPPVWNVSESEDWSEKSCPYTTPFLLQKWVNISYFNVCIYQGRQSVKIFALLFAKCCCDPILRKLNGVLVGFVSLWQSGSSLVLHKTLKTSFLTLHVHTVTVHVVCEDAVLHWRSHEPFCTILKFTFDMLRKQSL